MLNHCAVRFRWSTSSLLCLLSVLICPQAVMLNAQEDTTLERAALETVAKENPVPEASNRKAFLRSHFRVADSTQAWARLPRELPDLPSWARALVEPLPKATAALLKLDYLHRAENPLGGELSGKLRWVAADAIDCDYARRYAWSDLKRAGLSDEELALFTGDASSLSEADRLISDFARRMTLAAYQVTDQEMEKLIEMFGPEAVVAMAHTLAFANFENRLFLGLGVEVEPDGPLLAIKLDVDTEQQSSISVPERARWEELSVAKTISSSPLRLEWSQSDLGAIDLSLDKQKSRQSRIPLPPLSRLDRLPPAIKEHASKVVWSRVSMGYQPELTQSWFHLMQMFQKESQLDRIFANSVFWVVTRSNECFY